MAERSAAGSASGASSESPHPAFSNTATKEGRDDGGVADQTAAL
jgi:hypothetical protein